MTLISVIVPIFKGKHYINCIIRQVEKSARQIEGKVELILTNDDPGIFIDENIASDVISIKVINTDTNLGIHGARVKGFKHSQGDFILFLDQDDLICAEYFISQINEMNGADAVICKLIHGNREFYDRTRPFHKVINKRCIFEEDNYIVSPGQVLIKRDSVPEIWTKNIMRNNGADDWMLWICMFAEGRVFALNDHVLFKHTMNDNNTSLNTNKMIASEREVLRLVKNIKILSRDEENQLENSIQRRISNRMDYLDKMRRSFYFYDKWLRNIYSSKDPFKRLKSGNVHTAAVYGFGDLGMQAYNALTNYGIEVKYFIDINAEYLRGRVPIYTPDVALDSVDVIIIGLLGQENEIKGMLEQKHIGRVLSIREIADEDIDNHYDD